MQNWKLKKMSYQELISQLKVVRSILYYYQRGRDFPGTCQLCKVARSYHPRQCGSACPNCLWEIIEGQSCCRFAMEKFNKNITYEPSITGTPAWHKVRKPMLRRWARIIQDEKDSRTCGGG